jgi:hypothetical protein
VRQNGAFLGVFQRMSTGEHGLEVGSPGQPAEHATAGAAAAGLGRGPDFGLPGPAVRRAPGHVVLVRPLGHGSALCEREGEPSLPLLAVFFGHSQEADVLDLVAVRLSDCMGAAQGPGGQSLSTSPL